MSAYEEALAAVRDGTRTPEEAAADLVERMEPRARLYLLDGDTKIWPGLLRVIRSYNKEPIVAGAYARLGIPGIRFTDGPRGVVMGRSTCFPVAIARAATFDVELEEAIGRAIGAEARAQGANFFGGVCVNLVRHPAWGRSQESYGEEPVLLGEMGAALTRGVRKHVMACVKHYALNSMEQARFYVDVRVEDDVLHDVYLPHFKRVVDEGADAVMSAYNKVNGEWCGQHRTLLTDVLRDRWGFEGIVVSDFVWGLRDAVRSVEAGLDVEMPFRQQRAIALPKALKRKQLDPQLVDASAKRIVATQLRHHATLGAPPPKSCVASDEHRRLARRAAARGCVLLKNDDLLPLSDVRSIAVIGRLADADNTGDIGSSRVRPPAVVTPLDGIRAAFPNATVTFDDGQDVARAARVARAADVAVVVAGYTAKDEGEAFVETDADMMGHLALPIRTRLGRRVLSRVARLIGRVFHDGGSDRTSLRLHDHDEALLNTVAGANAKTVAVVLAGGAVLCDRWDRHVGALLLAWYPGMEGGHAIADVLSGKESPAGRLPVSIPRDEADLPYFERTARSIAYDRWWGQRRLDRDGREAAYPFGFGLGYTTFSLSDPKREADDRVRVTVTNTGERPGRTVVQLYELADEHPKRVLAGFVAVSLAPGAKKDVRIEGRGERFELGFHHGDPNAMMVP